MTWDQVLPAIRTTGAAKELAMDSTEFSAFYERMARPLWGYLSRVCGNAAMAEDLMQEAFVRFLCSDVKLEGDVHARRYLYKIATNLLRDQWRKPSMDSFEEFAETDFAAADRFGGLESQMDLRPAFAQMNVRERQILWLAHAEGYSHKEIAEVTGLNSASIRIMLFRARRKLATLLEKGVAA